MTVSKYENKVRVKVKVYLSTQRWHVGKPDVQLYLFLSSALDGGSWPASRPGPFALCRATLVPIQQEASWASQPVWKYWRRETFLAHTGIRNVLCGWDTWSLTLREERRFRVFESRVLRRIFGPKRDEVTWEWRKLRNVELNYLSPHPILFG